MRKEDTPNHKQTPEESRARHIQQVMEWQKRNPEKYKKAQTKYLTKPEIVKRKKIQAAEAYQALSKTEKRIRIVRTSISYHKKHIEERQQLLIDNPTALHLERLIENSKVKLQEYNTELQELLSKVQEESRINS